MHPPVTYAGVRLLALSHAVTLRTRDPRSRCLCRSSLPLLVFVWQPCVLYVYSIVVIVYTAAQSHYPWERKRAVSLG